MNASHPETARLLLCGPTFQVSIHSWKLFDLRHRRAHAAEVRHKRAGRHALRGGAGGCRLVGLLHACVAKRICSSSYHSLLSLKAFQAKAPRQSGLLDPIQSNLRS